MATEAGKDGSEQSAVAAQDEQLSTKEMERLSKLLQEDSELQKLHKQFVLGGVLTEAVFWATKRIFAGKSAVHKAYLKFVSNKMTEKGFRTKYCRAECLQSTKNAVVVAAAAEAAEDEELVAFLKRDDAWASEARHKIR